MPSPEDYHQFKAGDRFTALLLGYSRTYRVAKVELRTVRYSDDDVSQEPVIVTKSGLVWTTHVCGALLDFYGRAGVDYVPCPATKTWRSWYGPLKKGERASEPYAIGEE
jgi:hypothetical protein